MIEHALKYASLGLKVFPIREGLKTPATSNGFLAATTDESTIRAWWVENPNYNIAIRTGKESGIFCLDIDSKNGKDGFQWLNAQGDIPATPIQITPSGGKHYIFKTPDFLVTSNSGKLAAGIDIRGEQGYILVSPSTLNKTDTYKFSAPYDWMIDQGIGEIDISSSPQWLIDSLLDIISVYEEKNDLKKEDEINLSIVDVMKLYNIQLKEVKKGIFQGAHPIHGSDNGSNFKIDTIKNVWSCYRHTKPNGSPVGGGAVQLVAMMERVICCEDCSRGSLRGENFKKVVQVIDDKFNVKVSKVSKFNPMYEFAMGIRDGDLTRDYIYCIEDNNYYVYEDNYWKEVHELEINKTVNEEIPEVNKHSLSMKNQIFGHLRVMLQKRMDLFNSKNYINFPEGEFDPLTRKLYPHCKEHYSTTRIPYSYDENAPCPLWKKTLEEIFEGDEKKINTLQEFFGYCLVPDTSMKKALLLLGESNTGKSTVLFLFKDLIGKANYSTVPLKHMGHPQYTPMMINKLVNIDTDVSKTAEEYEEHFKKITSGEEIECNQKFIETFDFVPKCRIILAANIFPRITDHSSAFYNRLIIIPMERIFKQSEMDRNLVPKLKNELPGIFNWCVDGLHRLKIRGQFEELDFMEEAVKDLEDANNPSNLFFEEHIEIVMGATIEKGELYAKYKLWSETNKQYTLTAAMFSNAVHKRFHEVTPKKCTAPGTGKRIWRNIQYVHFKVVPQDNKGWND